MEIYENNETPRCKQRGIYFASKIYSVASHGEFNPRTRLKICPMFIALVLTFAFIFLQKDDSLSADAAQMLEAHQWDPSGQKPDRRRKKGPA